MPDRPGDMDERDVDARFASIVARWDGPLPDPHLPVEDAAPRTSDAAPGEPDAPDAPDAVKPPSAAPDAVGLGPAAPPAGTPEAGHPEAAAPEASPPDTGDPAAQTAAPPSPWVNPSPLDVVVPPTAWRTPEPTDPVTERAAAEAEAALEEEEHFEPPEVILPPQEDLHFWGAVIGLVAGPLMLLYVVFARPFHSTRWFVAAVVVSLVGFGLLILRQPKHRDPTSGDDGARI
ncbi:hypothetical protein GCM10023168_20230 [Fodinibacter luteus]|uniref:DUF308 domain-containing protein n=1 Tax=Fodinibacter luteus TaxID=552064 RepID=A0ABP8KFF6_9MICO